MANINLKIDITGTAGEYVPFLFRQASSGTSGKLLMDRKEDSNHGLCDIRFFTEWQPSKEPEVKNVVLTFKKLKNKWLKESAHISSISDMAMHPSYQQIIGMGKGAIPLILSELKKNPDHWFWALKAITGEDPVPPEKRGRIQQMAEEWLTWGIDRGYVIG